MDGKRQEIAHFSGLVSALGFKLALMGGGPRTARLAGTKSLRDTGDSSPDDRRVRAGYCQTGHPACAADVDGGPAWPDFHRVAGALRGADRAHHFPEGGLVPALGNGGRVTPEARLTSKGSSDLPVASRTSEGASSLPRRRRWDRSPSADRHFSQAAACETAGDR